MIIPYQDSRYIKKALWLMPIYGMSLMSFSKRSGIDADVLYYIRKHCRKVPADKSEFIFRKIKEIVPDIYERIIIELEQIK